MRAYAPNGTPIEGTYELITGTANVLDDSYERTNKGRINFEHEGYTEVCWDAQETFEHSDQMVFVDANGDLWRADQLVLSEAESEDELTDEELPDPCPEPLVCYVTRRTDTIPNLITAIESLLACCELNLDDMEPETRETIDKAQQAIKRARGG